MPTTTTPPEIPTIVLDSSDQAPRLARRFLAERFREWGIDDDYVGRLVVCELVTNAHLHGEGPIIVRVFHDGHDGLVTVEVWDAGGGRPVIRSENYAASSGRGLAGRDQGRGPRSRGARRTHPRRDMTTSACG